MQEGGREEKRDMADEAGAGDADRFRSRSRSNLSHTTTLF
jgi:hypothetical protein